MTAFPALDDLRNLASNTAAKDAFEAFLAATKELPGGADIATLAIASGSVTPATATVAVDTEGAAASDDLTTIAQTNHPAGRWLLLRSVDAARVVTVKHATTGVGHIELYDAADFILNSPKKWLLLYRAGTAWVEVLRSFGTDAASARTALGITAFGSNLVVSSANAAAARVFLELFAGGAGYDALGFRGMKVANKIGNQMLRFWQRGTSTSVPASSRKFLADHVEVVNLTDAVLTVDQVDDRPAIASAGVRADSAMRVVVSTADAALAASQWAAVRFPVEGYLITDIVYTLVSFQVWVRSSLTGTYTLAFRNGGADRVYLVPLTINVANTWEYKTATIAMHDLTSGTWNVRNGLGLEVMLVLGAGIDFQNTTGSWLSADDVAAATNVNWLATVGADFRIALPQFVRGPLSNPYDASDPDAELAFLQRYFSKSYDVGIEPGTGPNVEGRLYTVPAGSGSGQLNVDWRYPRRMRGTPTIATYNPATGTASQFQVITGGTLASVVSEIGDAGCTITNSVANTALVGHAIHATAQAEI